MPTDSPLVLKFVPPHDVTPVPDHSMSVELPSVTVEGVAEMVISGSSGGGAAFTVTVSEAETVVHEPVQVYCFNSHAVAVFFLLVMHCAPLG